MSDEQTAPDPVRYFERPRAPVPRPQFVDGVLFGNIALEASVTVGVGGVGFLFERSDEGWSGGEAVTIGRGTDIDEGWLTAARAVAVAVIQNALAELQGGSAFSDTLFCPDCRRLIAITEPVPGAPRSMDCGPVHVAHFDDGSDLVMHPNGAFEWAKK